MPKFVVNVTRFLRYREEVEASTEEVAKIEVEHAIKGGHSHPFDDELDTDVCNITEEDDDA